MKEVNIKVASSSSVKAVAGSITKLLDEGNSVTITAIGAGAVNQAVKALAMSRGFISVKGRDLYCCPGFTNVSIGESERTAIQFIIKII